VKLLVTGSRSDNRWGFILDTLDIINEDKGPFTEIIVGDATGVDHWAKEWAKERGIPFRVFNADWDDLSHEDAVIRTRPDRSKYDAKAGPRRNQEMVDDKPDYAAVFAGGIGTRDCFSRIRKAGIKYIEVQT
jgi:hypothetical protein